MKILLYGLNYAPEPTGIGKYTGEMGEWLASRGHEVEAIVAMPYYPAWKVNEMYEGKGFHEEVLGNVRVRRTPLYVPAAQGINSLKRILHETSFTFNSLRYWLPKYFARPQYDIVVAICPALQVGIYPAIFYSLKGVPWVLHVQDLQVDAALSLGMMRANSVTKLLYKMENGLLQHCTNVSTITEAMRRRIIEKGVPEQKTFLFPNWSDIHFIRPLPNKGNEFRQLLKVRDEQKLFIYSGNMGDKQGLDIVLEAADKLRNDERILFALVGDGAARPKLENACKKAHITNVSFLPIQPLDKLPQLLAAADVHLVIQKSEAADLVMPSKLTNIVSAGRPVIATAKENTTLHDVLKKNNIGLVSDYGDVESLVTNIKSMVSNPELIEGMGKNARRYAEAYLDKEHTLLNFELKLEEIVESFGGRE